MAGKSSDITLYHGLPTRSCRVRFLLEELSLPYKIISKEFKPVGLNGDDAEYREKVNPKGLLPGFHDGDITIFESIAILQYLVEQYDPEHKMSPPVTDKAARAAYLNWLTFSEASFAPSVVFPIMHTAVLPEEQRIPAAVPRFQAAAVENLKILDKALAGKPNGIVDNKFSAADIALYQTTYLAAEFLKMVDPGTYPNVAAWYAETAKRPAAAKAYTA